ncbi:arginine--tRNA ligase [Candidatus Nomurabacteria bacterium]|nr:arginine--tRNA ligase [Candidatus Nomurabacteria bacterium]
MSTLEQIKLVLQKNISEILNQQLELDQIGLDLPPNEMFGDYAFSCFELAKILKINPQEVAEKLNNKFIADQTILATKNAGPYLNLELNPQFLAKETLQEISQTKNFGQNTFGHGKKVLIEFSGPNTNKPQHLGHVRNDILGQAMVNLYRACGFEVIACNIINDRGIHIVKSMLAYQKWGDNQTPESSKIKGDHFVGNFYVKFEQALKAERDDYYQKNKIDLTKLKAQEQRQAEDAFLQQSPLMQEAHEMLKKWEAEDPETRNLWSKMNSWVYQGFEETYQALGIKFDQVYYESQTYLLGKEIIKLGLEKKVFFQKEDNSIWIDLSSENLDQKLVLRADGTSVYITQDLGMAKQRHDQYKFDQMIYVVANEQNYHFQVLFATLKAIGFPWAENLHHLSYGMVNLPDGKMKSREGKVVDADDLILEMKNKASEVMAKATKQVASSVEQKIKSSEQVGLGALKFFCLSTSPQKDITFNPTESISFDGYTGPFIQYTHARINNILTKAEKIPQFADLNFNLEISAEEKKLLKILLNFPDSIKNSALDHNPATLTQYLFDLAKTFNNFYQQHSVLQAESPDLQQFRLFLANATKQILSSGLELLGIEAPETM